MATVQKNGAVHEGFAQANNKIIEFLTGGIVPWDKPFTAAGIPRNIITRNQYRGINLLLLAPLGFERNFFITPNQLAEIKGSIKAKSKSHIVTFWNYPKESDDSTTKNDNAKSPAPAFSWYYVYNAEQCGWPEGAITPDVMQETHTIVPINDILQGMAHCPQIEEKGMRAFYDVAEDVIYLPKPKGQKKTAVYYTDLLRQLVHCTGHHTRLDRMGLAQMREYGYTGLSLEDLVADIATWYLKSITGLTDANVFDTLYVRVCIEKFNRDPRLIYTAATLAQQAIDFVLNVQGNTEEPVMVSEELEAA